MKCFWLTVLAAVTFAGAAIGEITSSEVQCFHSLALEANTAKTRKYAPDREVDVLHVALDIKPDFQKRTISGKSTISFKPIGKALRELKVDGVDLSVTNVKSSESIEGYRIADEQIIITFSKPIAAGKTSNVEIAYSAEPDRGLYFRTPEMGYAEGETHLWTQGEPEDHRYWYPAYDYPNEKFTTEITCAVPAGMTVLANGKQTAQSTNSENNLVTVTWKQEKPHVNYLVALVAGYFEKIENDYNGIPLAFYTPASDIKEATNSYRNTKDILSFFEKETGMPYPWEKYYQVVVRDFVAGGMENTGLTILTDRTLFTKDFESIRSSDSLVAHELAHQWFGDIVTCKDWNHLWLNEGFATYYDVLYDGHKNGLDSMTYRIWGTVRSITGYTNDPLPIVYREYDKPWDQFGYRAYQKGSLVLHMLRAELGPTLYRKCIQTYLERHQFGTVVTEDLNSVIEELSGRSYDRFFDQWVYHSHHPELDVEYDYDAATHLAKVSVKQTQKVSDNVYLFEFPLEVQFTGKFGTTNALFRVTGQAEDFYFPIASAPESVALDPKISLLAKTSFKAPASMLYAQLKEKNVGVRLNAVEQLGTKKNQDSVEKLKEALNKDAFWGVRVEAAKALQAIHTDEALAALIASAKQKDARARKQVITSIGNFYSEEGLLGSIAAMGEEKNPDILAQNLRNLGPYSTGEVEELLTQKLKSDSYRNVVAEGAIAAMRAQDNPIYIAPLLEVLKAGQDRFATRGYTAGLDTLAYLSRNESNRSLVREFLTGLLNSKKISAKMGAIAALGTLEDPQALAVLETFASAAKETPERTTAEKAIGTIRAAGRPSDNLKDLRKELLEIQKLQRETRKELDTLQKKLEAAPPKNTGKKK